MPARTAGHAGERPQEQAAATADHGATERRRLPGDELRGRHVVPVPGHKRQAVSDSG